MSHIDSVKQIYTAYENGDIDLILSKLSENVEWEYPETSTSVPWLQHRVGRENVFGFFESLVQIEIQKFEPHTFLEGPGVVVVLLDVEFVVRETGQQIAETDEIHVWRFNADGLVSKFKHGVDTHGHQLAIGPAIAR